MNEIASFLRIKVAPKASRNQIMGWENDELKVRLKAVPEKGEANECLIEFLSEIFKLPKFRIVLVSGHTSRHKRLRFEGVTEEDLKKLLKSHLKE